MDQLTEQMSLRKGRSFPTVAIQRTAEVPGPA
jgi:hypothetical protein